MEVNIFVKWTDELKMSDNYLIEIDFCVTDLPPLLLQFEVVYRLIDR